MAAHTIHRKSIVTNESEWVKMFDPPTASPATPERMAPTNPVPEVMQTNGLASVSTPHTVRRNLLQGVDVTTFDNNKIKCYALGDPDVPLASGGNFPAATIRVPRGVIFHGNTTTGSPPHTIHWHGIEPTPINDGVGHCSMELGQYIYQWQPNFIGSYFYHCHRNTVQHFEFGLYGLLLIDPPDAYHDPTLPGIGADGKRRTAANTSAFTQFPGFNSSPITSNDDHAYTIPYDVEALWVLQGLDSIWHSAASNPKDFFPKHGNQPGTDDEFPIGFFHDYNADYFFVTGVNAAPVPGVPGAIAIPPGLTIPPALNSAIGANPTAGDPATQPSQISISARVNQTILVRCLDAAYAKAKVSFPVDVVIIAWDGRALGVPPYGRYNKAYLVRANTPIEFSTARRFDALIRPTRAINSFATAQLIQQRDAKTVLTTMRIPFVIT
jgi:hypothetical protein